VAAIIAQPVQIERDRRVIKLQEIGMEGKFAVRLKASGYI